MNKPSLSLQALLESFLRDRLQNQRNVSAHTVQSYRDTFLLLLRFVKKQTNRSAAKQQLHDWDAPMIEKFLSHLERGRKNSARTRNARLAAIRSFLNYVGQRAPENIALAARVLAIPTKRFDRPLLGYFTRSEIRELLQIPEPTRCCDRRNHLLWLLLYSTGARISEILKLNRQDVQTQSNPSLLIHGKGRKERLIPLQPEVFRQLQTWLKELPPNNETPLFVNRLGQRLSRFGAHKNLKTHLERVSQRIPTLGRKKISAHTFRHSTAMHLLQKGVDMSVIALWLGHESIGTTHQYVELDLKMKKDCLKKLEKTAASRRFRPGDKLIRFLESL